MGSELVTDAPSPQLSKQGVEGNPSAPVLYSKLFREQLPYYISIGMTPSQFWDEDVCLAKYYRKADELNRKRKNQELWLQGMYVYEAILDCVPVLHAFAGKGAKPVPYPDAPYPLTEEDSREEKERKERAEYEKIKRSFLAKKERINKEFQNKRGD